MLIELTNLNKIYNKMKENECHALKNVNLKIAEGELIAIVGHSGSGKSTLLNIIGLIDSIDEGNYYLDSFDILMLKDSLKSKYRNKYFGYVMQDFALIPNMSVYDNIALPLYLSNNKVFSIDELVNQAIEMIGIDSFKNKKINQLSGGQKQRVAIARAIVHSPKIILADEPTGSLDQKSGNQIIERLISINKTGTTVIIVTHDMNIASRCDRIVTITDGILKEN